ncbi:MAG TPA: type II toxin-antitoxin system RelE/ParE family toxin [Rhizomicrobium sp.]
MNIEWHPLARIDLAELVEYIANDDPGAAYRVHEEILDQVALLAAHPGMGRIGRVRGSRELVVARTPYITAYRVSASTITVLRILHGARRWPRRL